ncbi:MAG: NAD(P)-binding protein [Vicinamibacteria bacterium]
MNSRDRRLGMDRPISRRDFLNGVRIAATGAAVGSRDWLAALGALAAQEGADYYPPALTGLRGSHDGSWETAHQLRDGKVWEDAAEADDQTYDLIVVGGGISGLAAAYFFRKTAGPRARILILDNHDDFGGHAKRNEFRTQKRLLIGYGGTQSIDSPSAYSPEAIGLLRGLAVDLERFQSAFDQKLYSSLNLTEGVFFDKETFGVDRLVAGYRRTPWDEFASRTPLPESAQKDLVRLFEEKKDYLAGLSSDEKKSRLAEISYADYLKDYVRVDPQVTTFFQASSHGLFGTGIEAVPALDCWGLSYPGFQGLNLDSQRPPAMGLTSKINTTSEPYIFHFPDGNASIARLLVRSLIPGSIPGRDMEDIVTAKADSGQLDRKEAAVRLRLNSTVVRVRHRGSLETARDVEVTYVRNGKAFSAQGHFCVLACWHQVIPLLCPELPDTQKRALTYAVKVPLVYTNVQLRDWSAFAELGVHDVYCPGGYHSEASLDSPVSLGNYHHPARPEEPILVHMVRTPCLPGLPPREQHIAGRYELLGTTFETFERQIRDQLGRMLSGGGFDPARDIEAITVNRWPHGYAYEYNSLFDPVWKEGEAPCVRARQRFGRIAIANSDAAAYAYTNAAIDQAYRAVDEITSTKSPSRGD